MVVGQGPTTLAVGAGGGCLDIFILLYLFSPLSPSLWETARYRLKYCLKGPLNPKQPTKQPTNFYLVCSNEGPRVQNGPLPGGGGPCLESQKYIEKQSKIFFFRTAMLKILNIGMKLRNENEIYLKIFYRSPPQLSKSAGPETFRQGKWFPRLYW